MADGVGKVIDSDIDFWTSTPPGNLIHKKSKLTKKKNKNKENVKKPHTSTQLEKREPLVCK